MKCIHRIIHAYQPYLLYEQFLAHCDALVESLLVFLQEFLLLINLPPQVTISLFFFFVFLKRGAKIVSNFFVTQTLY